MPKKIDAYDDERKDVVNKLFDILNINEKNNTFSLKKMDNDKEKQDKILELVPLIKKYFFFSQWGCFKAAKTPDRMYFSIIKNLLKNMNYIITSKRICIKENDSKYFDTIYYIYENKI
jgi:hypothetical protein